MRIAIALAAVWLQVSFFGALHPWGVIPNLAVIVVVLSALFSEATPTVATAVMIGLLLDIASGTDFGLRTAYFAALALGVITAQQYGGVHGDAVLAAGGLMVVGVISMDLLLLLSLGLGAWEGHIWFIIQHIGVELALTLVLGIGGYLIASNLSRRLPGGSEQRPL